jgi:hypothetical protein
VKYIYCGNALKYAQVSVQIVYMVTLQSSLYHDFYRKYVLIIRVFVSSLVLGLRHQKYIPRTHAHTHAEGALHFYCTSILYFLLLPRHYKFSQYLNISDETPAVPSMHLTSCVERVGWYCYLSFAFRTARYIHLRRRSRPFYRFCPTERYRRIRDDPRYARHLHRLRLRCL